MLHLNSVVYYNEIDPYCCQWLRNLIVDEQLPFGEVDQRDIREVTAHDVKGYTQCHFFAGIGGWAYALAIAGWPADREVWTGSCPCQPFSCAGKRRGEADDRHLWPDWGSLISVCHPPVVFGEQVAGRAATGWLDGVFDDLEAIGYACGAAIIPACSVGFPHQRDRLWFVADSDCGDQYRRDRAVQVGRGRRPQETAAVVPFLSEWAAQPAIPPVAYGISSRMEQCNAYGNAIVPQAAAEFIKAFMDCR